MRITTKLFIYWSLLQSLRGASSRDEPRTRVRRVYDTYGTRDLPVVFRAPSIQAQDYWNAYQERPSERRNFQHPPPPYNPFYQFMNAFFAQPQPQPYDFYPNAYPHVKPVRASVIKLETFTEKPDYYPTVSYTTTAEYYPHFVNLLNQVLIENAAKHGIDETVLERPDFVHADIVPTTYKPAYNFKRMNLTGKYPDSIQDQLPHTQSDFLYPTTEETRSSDGIDIRSGVVIENATVVELPEVILEQNPSNIVARNESDMLAQSTESHRVVRKFPKKLHSTKVNVTKSVESITDLTVRGLSRNSTRNVNIPAYVNRINMSDVIDYEISKWNQGLDPRTEETPLAFDDLSLDAKILRDTNWDGFQPTIPTTTEMEEPQNQTVVVETRVTKSVSTRINATKPKTIETTTENQLETTTDPKSFEKRVNLRIETKTNELEATTDRRIESQKEENLETTTSRPRRVNLRIDDENLITGRTETTTTFEFPTTDQDVTTRVLFNKLLQTTTEDIGKRMDPPNFDETFDIAAMIIKPTESATRHYRKRKYSRKPKLVNFTQYPEIKKGGNLTRNADEGGKKGGNFTRSPEGGKWKGVNFTRNSDVGGWKGLNFTRNSSVGVRRGVNFTRTPDVGGRNGVNFTRTPNVGGRNGVNFTRTPDVGGRNGVKFGKITRMDFPQRGKVNGSLSFTDGGEIMRFSDEDLRGKEGRGETKVEGRSKVRDYGKRRRYSGYVRRTTTETVPNGEILESTETKV